VVKTIQREVARCSLARAQGKFAAQIMERSQYAGAVQGQIDSDLARWGSDQGADIKVN